MTRPGDPRAKGEADFISDAPQRRVPGKRELRSWVRTLTFHLEMVHGCEHTSHVRNDLGMPPPPARTSTARPNENTLEGKT